MRVLLMIGILFAGAASASAENKYFGLVYDTTAGSATQRISGGIRISSSANAHNRIQIYLNGRDGTTSWGFENSRSSATALGGFALSSAAVISQTDNFRLEKGTMTFSGNFHSSGSIITMHGFSPALILKNRSDSQHDYIYMSFNSDTDGRGLGAFMIDADHNASSVTMRASLDIQLRSVNSDIVLMGAGSVGINTITPAPAIELDVNGAAAVRGSFSVPGSSITAGSHIQAGAPVDTVDTYIQGDSEAGAPPAGDCDANSEAGRMIVDHTNDRLYICNNASGRGWDFIALTD